MNVCGGPGSAAVRAPGGTCETALCTAGRRIDLVSLEAKVEGHRDVTGQHVWLVLHLYNGLWGHPFEIHFLCI